MRNPWMLLVLTLLLIFAPSTSADKIDLPKEKEKWVEFHTKHFRVLSQADRESAWEQIRRLDLFRLSVSALFPGLSPSQIPVTVYVFNDKKAYRRWGAPKRENIETAGVYYRRPYGDYIALNASGDYDPVPVIFHEYSHYLLSQATAAPMPVWLNEGLAEYFTTFFRKGNGVALGSIQGREGHIYWLRSVDLLPLRQILEATHDSEEYDHEELTPLFYGQSWLLTHLLLSMGDGRALLHRLLDEFERGASSEEALLNTTGFSVEILEEYMDQHLYKDSYQYTVYDFSGDLFGELTHERKIDYVDLLSALGRLVLHKQHESPGDARPFFEKALELDSSRAEPFEGLGMVACYTGEDELAPPFYDEAMARDSTSHMIPFLAAESVTHHLRDLITADDTSSASHDDLRAQARKYYRRCLDLAPEFGPAHAGLGGTFVGTLENPAPAIEALEFARAREPKNTGIAWNLFMCYLAGDSLAAAERVFESSLERILRPELLEEARAILDQAVAVVHQREEQLVRNDSIEFVAPSTDQALSRGENGAAPEDAAHGKYLEALGMVKQGDFATALELLREVAGAPLPADLRDLVETTIQEIEELTGG